MLTGLVDGVGEQWRADDANSACDAIIVAVRRAAPSRPANAPVRRFSLPWRGADLGACAYRVYPSPARHRDWCWRDDLHELAYAAGVEPVFCGKPQKIFFHETMPPALRRSRRCVLIGDNLEADVVMVRQSRRNGGPPGR